MPGRSDRSATPRRAPSARYAAAPLVAPRSDHNLARLPASTIASRSRFQILSSKPRTLRPSALCVRGSWVADLRGNLAVVKEHRLAVHHELLRTDEDVLPSTSNRDRVPLRERRVGAQKNVKPPLALASTVLLTPACLGATFAEITRESAMSGRARPDSWSRRSRRIAFVPR